MEENRHSSFIHLYKNKHTHPHIYIYILYFSITCSVYRKNNHLQVWKCILHTFLFLLLLQLFFIGCLSYQWASLHLFLKLLQFALVNLDTNTGKRRENVENCPSAATTGDANPTRVLFVKNEHWRLWLWSQMMRASGCVIALNWFIVIRLWALPLYCEFLDKYVAHKQFMHHYKGKNIYFYCPWN